MAEQDTHQHTADVNEGETQSTNMDHASASNEDKQEDPDIVLNAIHSEDSASLSGSTNGETRNDLTCDVEHIIMGSDAAEEKILPLKETSSPDEASMLVLEANSTLPEVDEGSHGDYNGVGIGNEQPISTGDDGTGEKTAKTTTLPTQEGKDDQVDGPNSTLNEGTTDISKAEAAEVDESSLDIWESRTPPQSSSDEEEVLDQRNTNVVETLGPVTQETTEPAVPGPESPGGSRSYLTVVGVVVVVVVAALVQHLLQTESPLQKEDLQQTAIFLRQMEKLKTQFPKQRAELWNRSKIHLLKHLQTAQPTEPVSLILTAGVRAERTLQCLARGLASAFSSALNASVLHIDGASKASQDSDQVKLDIDSKLQGAFEGDKPVAVIHRFEELPPGSTLIFYRYCDHEHAAYKKTFLIFTVLLGEEEEIPPKSHLTVVEEMVDDHLQKKFLSAGLPVSFDRMDIDKYGGLWSRISHLILPVAAEKRMEHEGCLGT